MGYFDNNVGVLELYSKIGSIIVLNMFILLLKLDVHVIGCFVTAGIRFLLQSRAQTPVFQVTRVADSGLLIKRFRPLDRPTLCIA